MKIGILTHFHKSTNYGGVLQAYALCKYLNTQGHSASQILYKHEVEKISDSALTLKDVLLKSFLRFKRKVYRKKNRQIKKRMESLFVTFRDKVPHTQREYTKADIGDTIADFDIFVVGSDQVWNPIWYDSSYMLDFVPIDIAKISYAASIGVGYIDEKQERIFKGLLMDFKAVSVRESVAAEILSPIIKREIEVSVDPTLLLSADEWDEIASQRKIKEKYIFLYLLGEDKNARKLAEKFAKNKNLKLVMIPDLMGAYRKCDRKIKGELILDATPCDFISLIKYAEYVFTDSFHACVFSLIYQKQLFAFQRMGDIKMESRVQNLLELFDCCERFCKDKRESNLQYILSLRNVDYSIKSNKFIKVQKMSKDYLNRNIH